MESAPVSPGRDSHWEATCVKTPFPGRGFPFCLFSLSGAFDSCVLCFNLNLSFFNEAVAQFKRHISLEGKSCVFHRGQGKYIEVKVWWAGQDSSGPSMWWLLLAKDSGPSPTVRPSGGTLVQGCHSLFPVVITL